MGIIYSTTNVILNFHMVSELWQRNEKQASISDSFFNVPSLRGGKQEWNFIMRRKRSERSIWKLSTTSYRLESFFRLRRASCFFHRNTFLEFTDQYSEWALCPTFLLYWILISRNPSMIIKNYCIESMHNIDFLIFIIIFGKLVYMKVQLFL